ncbi:MAG TPA: diacylglycerol kinase family protein [Chthonomonadaceae bacterium]|nr:diacylglycerol kinase family protein [Chthonomonadaceae bacterium]
MSEAGEQTTVPAPAGEHARASREAALIVNTRARRGQEWFARAQACLRAQGFTLRPAYSLTDPSRLPDLVRQSLAEGAKLIVVGGGDGTLRCAADVLAYTDAALGVLPLGTVNDFARNLGIAPSVEAACEVLAAGNAVPIDLGQANESYFLLTASLGFSARMQRFLSPTYKKRFGPFGYVLAGFLALRRLRAIRITLRYGQMQECLRVLQAGVINGHLWMGGALSIPGVDLESGKLAFYALPPQSKWAFLKMTYHVMHGRFFHTPGLRAFLTDDITVETETPHPLVLDGDLCGKTPVRLRVARDALKVFVPPDFRRPAESGPIPPPEPSSFV